MTSTSISMSLVSPSRRSQQHLLLSPSSVAPPLSAFFRRAHTSVIFSSARTPALLRIVCCSSAGSSPSSAAGERREVRLGLPSKGRMADDTLGLLKDCQLSVKRVNPRQYVAEIPQLSNLQVWFQRPKDIVKKLLSGDLDIGIVGFDTVSEHGQGNQDLIIVHEALDYGDCRLSLAIPKYGIFEKINSVKELAQMPQWTEEKPLRVATGFGYLGPKFMKENGLKHVSFSTGEGALEAAPAMGTADVILDLVSSGTTLKENNLKEIEGGTVLESQAVLVASRKSLIQREGVLGATHEILERLEAHLKAVGQFTVTAYMSGSSAGEVDERVLGQPSLSGLQMAAAFVQTRALVLSSQCSDPLEVTELENRLLEKIEEGSTIMDNSQWHSLERSTVRMRLDRVSANQVFSPKYLTDGFFKPKTPPRLAGKFSPAKPFASVSQSRVYLICDPNELSLCGSLFFPLASSTRACVASSHEAAMEVADKKEMGKGKNEALRLKRCGEEEEEAKEEAPGAPYELENLDSEDDSEDVLSGVVKSMEELGSGERDSQEHGIPKTGIHEKINLMKELAQMSQWTEVQPLRVATGFEYQSELGSFFKSASQTRREKRQRSSFGVLLRGDGQAEGVRAAED
ncbi:hypothetical protein ACJRO7_026577 [Eucalyptus globulus]|uniref:ATP phosphoribosyltransferase n=1 Tax=Eucalyptus globulus TaxID=34317 RepID=A0ABD3JSA9_EUCGL